MAKASLVPTLKIGTIGAALNPFPIGVNATSPFKPQQDLNTIKETTQALMNNAPQINTQNADMSGLKDQISSLMSMINQQNQMQSEAEARINALNQAKQAQAIADLGKARDTQLSNLVSEEAGIKPMYNNKRNATAATNMMGRRTLAEELASRGEARSGVADEANIRANMSLQGDTNALNMQEASDTADIARRKTGVQNAYESDVASAKAGLDAATMQNLINQYNTDKQFKLQEAGLTGTYNGNQTLDALNANRNYALNEAGLTGKYNGSPTLAAQNQTFNQNLATKQYNQQVAQQKLDNLYRQQSFDYQKSRDAVSDNQWQQNMNLNLRNQSFSEAQAKISNALSQSRITQEDAAQALQWAKFNAEQDPNSLDNQLKRANIDTNTYSKNTAALNDTIQRLDSLYIYKDTNGVPKRNPNYSDTQLRSAIIGLNLSDDQTDTLLLRYGLPINQD